MTDRVWVQKFGGSSVADVAKIKAVAQRVAARRKEGIGIVVVVSAMGDTTDDLLKLAKQVSPNPSRRELDMLLTAGERISMALLSMALNDVGTPAISFTGSQSGIITSDDHAQARIEEVRPHRVQEALSQGKVVIVAGYQGVSRTREVTTLGRGGSDTTAVAMAAALKAEACEIYSDVDGVFSADPRVVPAARKLEGLSYEEMQELAKSGARVLNAAAVEFARTSGVVIRALSTFQQGTGTTISAQPGGRAVSAIATDTETALIRFPAAHRGAVEGFLEARRCPWFELVLVGSPGDEALAVPMADVHDAAFVSGLQGLGASVRDDLARVSAVGTAPSTEQVKAALGGDAGALAWCLRPLSLGVLVPRAEQGRVALAAHAALIER